MNERRGRREGTGGEGRVGGEHEILELDFWKQVGLGAGRQERWRRGGQGDRD